MSAVLTRAGYGLEGLLLVAGALVLLRLALERQRESGGSPAPGCPAAPAFPPWPGTVSDLFLLFAVAVGGALLLPVIASFALRHAPLGETNARFIIMIPAFEAGLLAGICCFHYGYLRLAPSARAPALHSALVLGALTFLAAFPIVGAVNFGWTAALDRVGMHVSEQTVAQLFQELPSLPLRIAFGFFACVAAPFNEELLFRAGIFRCLRSRMPRWAAILISALIFGAAHWALDRQAGAASFLPLVAFGIVLAVAYERTGRISTTIIAHALFNLNSLLALCVGLNA
ncbi:MAG: lysostaphin resistance A-like protein [Opitutaceae bacterium]